jgi:hypothetical protein
VPESAVSGDLFADRVLIERQVFFEAQAKALESQRQTLTEEGWAEVVIGSREEVQDRLYAMNLLEREFDEQTCKKLAKLSARRDKLETMSQEIDQDDETKLERLQQRYEILEEQEQEIINNAPEHFSEETKAMATVFLILDPGGQLQREYRLPRPKHTHSIRANGENGVGSAGEKPKAPTSDELSDNQLAVTFTHQALRVREALLKNPAARKRILAIIVHDKIRSEALSVCHEPNGTSLHAGSEGFTSAMFDQIKEKRAKLDPFHEKPFVVDTEGYEQLKELSAAKLDALIDLLTVECITAHLRRQTELVHHLAKELKVHLREFWRPDAQWLSGFRKIQLAHLIVELKGQMHAPAAERKKSELVEVLAKLFADAAEGKLQDQQLAKTVNAWMPSNLRNEVETSQS